MGYIAWKQGEEIGQRVIPYKRMGTQNFFYAADSLYEYDEENEEDVDTRFNAKDFLIKDLEVATTKGTMEQHIELATVDDVEQSQSNSQSAEKKSAEIENVADTSENNENQETNVNDDEEEIMENIIKDDDDGNADED